MENADRGNSGRLDLNGNGHPLVTTVIGSWPKPEWLSSRSHDTSGWTVDRDWKFQAEELKVKQDEATEWAIRQQEATGVDIVSDGEQRHDNYIYYFCRRLEGFDFENRARIDSRSGAWSWTAPRIAGPVASTGAFFGRRLSIHTESYRPPDQSDDARPDDNHRLHEKRILPR